MNTKPNLKRQAIEQRRRARSQLLQLLYQWQLADDAPERIYHNRIIDLRLGEIDQHYFDEAYEYITQNQEQLEAHYQTLMSRKLHTLDPVERAILWIGAYEILNRPDIHPTVSINESIELAKRFGAQESYKFINGILDKLSKSSSPTSAN